MAVNNNGAWPYRVIKGDILKDACGNLRVVRKASYGKSGLTTYVYLSIKHCSWTGRCYTCLCYSDLKIRGFRPIGRRKKLTSRMDKRIARDLEYKNRFDQKTDCCDVKGVS